MEKYLREPVNGLTHMIGAILSLIALVAMLIKSHLRGCSLTTFGIIFWSKHDIII